MFFYRDLWYYYTTLRKQLHFRPIAPYIPSLKRQGFTAQFDKKVGGAVVRIDGTRGDLDLLFTSPNAHNKGIGYAAWCEIERLHPEVEVWETVTPYFETRNIHFYVNRCGFHIVKYFNKYHKDPNEPEESGEGMQENTDGMFRFEKRMNWKSLS